jgi:hypothetical protein
MYDSMGIWILDFIVDIHNKGSIVSLYTYLCEYRENNLWSLGNSCSMLTHNVLIVVYSTSSMFPKCWWKNVRTWIYKVDSARVWSPTDKRASIAHRTGGWFDVSKSTNSISVRLTTENTWSVSKGK